jgi:NAD(P)-dependent dehydrogenase (short-subunit alcohol dehydrogenase family)
VNPLTVVITGSSSGIGKASALYLAERGHRVFAGVRSVEQAERLRSEASERLVPLLIDVTDSASLVVAVERVDRELAGAPLSGLVNNAGIAIGGPIEHTPLADFRKQLEVNVVGLLATTQAFLPLLRRGPSRIVNIGSMSGRVTTPMLGAYCASKYAVEALTDALRMELGPFDIETSVVEPGPVESEIWDKARRQSQETIQNLSEQARAQYGSVIEAANALIERNERSAVPALDVARAVEHALTAKRPKTRYVIGSQARAGAVLKSVLPDRWLDAALKKSLGLP